MRVFPTGYLAAMLGVWAADCLWHSAAKAESNASAYVEARIENVDERGRLLLADGRELCLAGVSIPPPGLQGARGREWRSAWRGIVQREAFVRRSDQPVKLDRYGCELAQLENEQGALLQHRLLADGWALTDPWSAPDDDETIDVMLRIEDRARRLGVGMWDDPESRPLSTEDLSDRIGERQLIEGRVRRVSDNDRYVYLNFGSDWRTDFTIRLDRKMIDTAGFDISRLDGTRLRARGVLQESRGPLMDIMHLQQIELLP